MKKRLKNKNKRVILSVFILAFIAGIGFFGYQLFRSISPTVDSERYFDHMRKKVKQQANSQVKISFEELSGFGGDTIGWITNPDTPIDYPIMQSEDNEYYLNHLSDGTYNENGSVFMDYENASDFSDEITTIYGHHITLDRMFSPLSHYKNQEYYEEHPVMTLYTNDKIYEVVLFAGNIVSGQERFPISFDDSEKRSEFIEERISRSTFQSDVTVEEEDKILILCTCSYEYTDARYAVFGKLVERIDR